MAKQNKLLEEQNSKMKEIQDQLALNEELIIQHTKKVQEYDEMIAKWPILETLIANVTSQILNTRRALREMEK